MLWSTRDEWEIVTTASGPEAIAALDASSFDVVVSDMRMPGMTGAELLRVVKDRHPGVTRIILSGQDSEENSLASASAAHQFLGKPCDTDTLRATLRRALNGRRLLVDAPLQSLVSQIGTLPSPASLFLKLVEELQSPEPSVHRVADLVAGDPAMAAKILQLVNSAFFGIQRHIPDPHQATMLLGLKTVSMLVLSIRAFAEFEPAVPAELGLANLMPHCLRTSVLARTIGRDLSGDGDVAEGCAAAGLLHDLGKLILGSRLPERSLEVMRHAREQDVPCADVERQLLGCTHAEVGAYLLCLWGLPDETVDAVAFHHTPLAAPDPSNVALAAVHVADVLDGQQHGASACHPPTFDARYLEELGLTQRIARWQSD